MVAGGLRSGVGTLDSVYLLDLSTGVWSDPAAPLPAGGRFGHTMVYVPPSNGGTGAVLVAGGHCTGVGTLDSVYTLDLATMTRGQRG